MRADNPMTLAFLLRYPVEAARILEQLSSAQVAALVSELPTGARTPVLAVMLPERLAASLLVLPPQMASAILAELPLSSAARAYQQLTPSDKQALSAWLPKDSLKRIRQFTRYPADSVGALCMTAIDSLPQEMTVHDALRRLEQNGHPIDSEIYITDDQHHLRGYIETGKLIAARHPLRLHEVMTRKTHAINAQLSADTVLSNPGWKNRLQLPVVDRDNILIGALNLQSVRDALGNASYTGPQSPMDTLFSFAGLYWQVMAQLLDSALNISPPKKEVAHDRD